MQQDGVFFFLVPITILFVPFLPKLREVLLVLLADQNCVMRVQIYKRKICPYVSVRICRTWGRGYGGGWQDMCQYLPRSSSDKAKMTVARAWMLGRPRKGRVAEGGRLETGRSRVAESLVLDTPDLHQPSATPLTGRVISAFHQPPLPRWLPVESRSAIRNPFPLVLDYVCGPSRQQGRRSPFTNRLAVLVELAFGSSKCFPVKQRLLQIPQILLYFPGGLTGCDFPTPLRSGGTM